MAGSMARMYGAATMVGKDEMNGRINPALEADDDLPVVEAQRSNQQKMQAAGLDPIAPPTTGSTIPSNTGQGHTAF